MLNLAGSHMSALAATSMGFGIAEAWRLAHIMMAMSRRSTFCPSEERAGDELQKMGKGGGFLAVIIKARLDASLSEISCSD
jgi:hypothetical protein